MMRAVPPAGRLRNVDFIFRGGVASATQRPEGRGVLGEELLGCRTEGGTNGRSMTRAIGGLIGAASPRHACASASMSDVAMESPSGVLGPAGLFYVITPDRSKRP
jgi:hypothetical protein